MKLTAKNADKYVLYQEAVQNPEFEVKMVERFYKKLRGKKPGLLREDFSGTFIFSCEWVKRSKEYKAIAIDLDPEPLEWGRKNNLAKLKPSQQERITIKEMDVMQARRPQVDIVCAFNFSYWLFTKRQDLLTYYKSVYNSLEKDGMFVMDCFGGSETHSEQEEPRKCDGFTYVWEHAKFFPLTSEMTCKIHFEFKDGSKMRNAFRYDWRLWSPLEINELLTEAGFKTIEYYWEGTDEDTGEGNGVFRKSKRGEAAECWIAYIVALK